MNDCGQEECRACESFIHYLASVIHTDITEVRRGMPAGSEQDRVLRDTETLAYLLKRVLASDMPWTEAHTVAMNIIAKRDRKTEE